MISLEVAEYRAYDRLFILESLLGEEKKDGKHHSRHNGLLKVIFFISLI